MPSKSDIRRERATALRATMISNYGGACVFCGEDDPIVLVLDHIYDDGYKEVRPNGKRYGGTQVYMKLAALGWPRDRHQLLCANCNVRKEHARRQRAREELRVTLTKPRKKEKK